jgi:competence protein ComEA
MKENWQRFKWVDGLLILGLILVVVGIGMNFKNNFLSQDKTVVVSRSTPTIKPDVEGNNKVTIDIAGEVINPGVYSLDAGARINDGLVAAGGLAAKADRDWVEKNINRAEKLSDGQKIYIPKLGENVSKTLGVSVVPTGGQVSLNKASVAELDRLSGVGPALAQAIIDYREQNGGFKNIEELKLVPGIGEKLFAKIKTKVSL